MGHPVVNRCLPLGVTVERRMNYSVRGIRWSARRLTTGYVVVWGFLPKM